MTRKQEYFAYDEGSPSLRETYGNDTFAITVHI